MWRGMTKWKAVILEPLGLSVRVKPAGGSGACAAERALTSIHSVRCGETTAAPSQVSEARSGHASGLLSTVLATVQDERGGEMRRLRGSLESLEEAARTPGSLAAACRREAGLWAGVQNVFSP